MLLFEVLTGIAPCSNLLMYLQVAHKQVATTAVPSEYSANSTWLNGCNAVQVWPESTVKYSVSHSKWNDNENRAIWVSLRSLGS